MEKGAIESLAKCLEIENQKYGISFHLFHPTTGDGYYESCILDPEGNQIEITADTYF